MIIVLPWPDRKLSPNARTHWRAKIKPKQSARLAGYYAAFAAAGFTEARKAFQASDAWIPAKVTFYPPDKRRRDEDNLVASLKHARDGVADALGIDDSRFKTLYFIGEPEPKGSVVMEL